MKAEQLLSRPEGERTNNVDAGADHQNQTDSQSSASECLKLRADGLRKLYGSKVAVEDLSFSMDQGEIVGLLGPNGAGKTTTFYIIAGFLQASKGSVWFGSRNITSEPMYKRARLGISYLPQEPSVFRKLTVAQNIDAVLEVQPRMSQIERKRRREELTEDLCITHLCKQRADTLSGGERRRTEICRALATNPSFLLLDEPFSGIDPIAVGDLRKIIQELADKGIGVLITDHNVRDTLSITGHAYIINHGSILTRGSSEDLINDVAAREKYLGSDFSM